MNSNQYFLLLFAAFTLLSHPRQAVAQQTTAFTYQGQLRDGGTNANGAYTMIFKLYDAISAGSQIGGTLTTSPTLANGLFTVNLDFGAGAFNGTGRWLDITAKSGTNAPETLTPRLQVLPTPYALFAAVAATVTNGAIMNAQLAGNAVKTANIQNNAVTTTELADGAVTNRNLTANAVATVNIKDAAVTDAKIVSTSGSKISGTVASAASLTNGSWNTRVFNFSGTSYFGIYDNNTLVMFCGPDFVRVGSELQIGNDGPSLKGNANSELFIDAEKINVRSLSSLDNTASVEFNTGSLVASGNLSVSGKLFVSGTVDAVSFNTTSDRNLKEKFAPISSKEILARVIDLPISSWNFKTDGNTRHIGPMAQDFYAAFNVGPDDKHIATVDADGVAFAAIQGLNQKLKEKDARIEAMEKRLADLEELIKSSTHK